jgi:hypothetical protein
MEEITENTGAESGTAGASTNAEAPAATVETPSAVTSTESPEKVTTTEVAVVPAANATQTEKPAVKPSEIKIVITHKDSRALVGISKTDFDPIFFIATGDLDAVVDQLPKFVQDTKEKWQSFQRYPKAATPPPPPAATQAKPVTTAAVPKKDTLQPRMY